MHAFIPGASPPLVSKAIFRTFDGMRIILLLIIIQLSASKIEAQEDQKFFFGVNVGAKFANKNYALRYQGYYPNTGLTGNLENVLYQQNNYDRIYNILGEKNFQLPYDTYPTNYHPGGAGGSKGTASVSYNAGGGAVIFVTGTKPLPSGLTLAAAQGTSGSGTATAGTVVTVYNIAATEADPST